MNLYIIICFILFFISILFIKGKKKTHKWRLDSAEKTLKKVRTFEHDGQILNYLKKIDAFVFEEILLFVFNERKEIKILRNEKYTGDGGVDGIFFIGKDKYLIQAKRYKDFVNTAHIKKFIEDIEKNKAVKGYFIHTGKTREATKKDFIQNEKIDIISGTKLVHFIRTGDFN